MAQIDTSLKLWQSKMPREGWEYLAMLAPDLGLFFGFTCVQVFCFFFFPVSTFLFLSTLQAVGLDHLSLSFGPGSAHPKYTVIGMVLDVLCTHQPLGELRYQKEETNRQFQ